MGETKKKQIKTAEAKNITHTNCRIVMLAAYSCTWHEDKSFNDHKKIASINLSCVICGFQVQ